MTEETIRVDDGRNDLPIFIHSELDDMKITSAAFRIYAHLARRAGKDNKAWPSYATMGEQCFRMDYPGADSATLRRKAIAAIKELIDAGLIVRTLRKAGKEHTTNSYKLVPKTQWGGGALTPPSALTPGGALTPKGTPLEDTPGKEKKEKDIASSPTAPKPSQSATPKQTRKRKSDQLAFDGEFTPNEGQVRRADGQIVPSQSEMYGIICTICGIDPVAIKDTPQAKNVGKVASNLRKSEYTVDELRRWWKEVWRNNYRGKDGGKPTPNLLAQMIGQIRPAPPEVEEDEFVFVGTKVGGKYYVVDQPKNTVKDGELIVPKDQIAYYLEHGHLHDGI